MIRIYRNFDSSQESLQCEVMEKISDSSLQYVKLDKKDGYKQLLFNTIPELLNYINSKRTPNEPKYFMYDNDIDIVWLDNLNDGYVCYYATIEYI